MQFSPIPDHKNILQRIGIKHHEYWPMWQLALPIVPIWFINGLRLGKISYVTAVNPAIEGGGFCHESKMVMNALLPKELLPTTVNVILSNSIIENVLEQIKSAAITYPCIAKPEYGGRGRKVAVIYTDEELTNYHNTVGENYMVQQKIEHPIEMGIFFYKLPNTPQVIITSVVIKDFLTVIGDGESTISALLAQSYRGQQQVSRLAADGKVELLNTIVQANKSLVIEPIGNHCKGTTFLDARSLINTDLVNVFTAICNKIDGVNYGRFDLKVASLEDLYQGKNIKVMELNGINADPAHIFDPNASLREAYRAQWEQTKYAYKIAKYNINAGHKPLDVKTYYKRLKKFIGLA